MDHSWLEDELEPAFVVIPDGELWSMWDRATTLQEIQTLAERAAARKGYKMYILQIIGYVPAERV